MVGSPFSRRPDRVEMPGQQDVELLGRLVGYPVADTLEHLERVWARDEPRGERGALGSDRRISPSLHTYRVGTVIMARNARGLENTIARYQLSAPWAASRSRVRMASRAAAADDRPAERSDLSQDFPEVSCRSGNQGSWKKNIYLDLRAWLLVNIALTNAAGCGTDRAVSDLSRSGRRAAASHATTAPSHARPDARAQDRRPR